MEVHIPGWLIMSMFTVFVASVVGSVIVWVLLPWMRLEFRRRRSRKIRPRPMQIWMQDDDLLYIDAVDQFGVEIIHWGDGAGSINKWKDTWAEWEERLRVRSVWYTGTQRPLGNA